MRGQRPLRDALSDNDLQNQVVHAWSMKGFVPADESGHDHFFATFGKFGVALDGHDGDGLATVARRARSEHVDYLLQMRMLRYLRHVYPVGHMTLHAGELASASPAARASFRSLRGTSPIATTSGKEQWQ
jgi:hypothetical protein